MAIFELNFKVVKEDIDALKRTINDYKMVVNIIKGELTNVDSFWNDYNTIPFIETIKVDYNNYLNHIEAMSLYVKNIEQFCYEIKECVKKNTECTNITKLYYNSEKISSCIQDYDNILSFLNEALSSLNSMVVPLLFKYKIFITMYKKDIKNMIRVITLTRDSLQKINRNINNILIKSKDINTKIEFKTVDNRQLNYKWQTFTSELKKMESIDDKEYSVIKNNIEVGNSSNIELLDVNNIDYLE